MAKTTSSPPEEVGVDELPKDFLTSVTTMFGHPCKQRLLRGKYGITAFQILEPKTPAGTKRKVCVFSHGLGQCWGDFDVPLLQTLVAGGYTVLGYSFYGHGWSYAGDEVMGVGGSCCGGPMVEYGSVVHLQQVKELLTHVMEPVEPVDCWVGHSTGGVIGVYVAAAEIWKIRTFAGISAAFWAEKPCLSKQIEKCKCLIGLVTRSAALLKAGEGDYLANNDVAFGKKDGKHLFPEKVKASADQIVNNFKYHPQLVKAIATISFTFLRANQMHEHRELFHQLVKRPDGPEKILLLWGTQDTVVPYEHAHEVVAWDPKRVKLVSPLLGHESIGEDPTGVAQTIVDELASAAWGKGT
jgi:pimeloyl-ACP methyl ester carboxylesterase